MNSPSSDPTFWSDYLRRTLACYDEPLVRQLAANLFKPRSQWPVEELIDRSLTTLGNPVTIDRRLQEIDPSARQLLTLLSHSGQPRWRLGSLLELAAAVGPAEGPRPVFTLFEAGLLYPDLLAAPRNGTAPRLKTFEQWLGQGGATGFTVFAPPRVMARAVRGDPGLPELPVFSPAVKAIHEADGLEWLLRLAAVWQQLNASSLRRTQLGEFFKRDLDRLRADPLLSGAPSDNLAELPDAGLLAVALAELLGVARTDEGELRAGVLPACWEEGLPKALAALWAALPQLETWNPVDGWSVPAPVGNPYPSAGLLALLLLARLPAEAWTRPQDVEQWLMDHHPFWQGSNRRPAHRRRWVPQFLLGLAYQLRLIQAARGPQEIWLVRLTSLGRWLLGLTELPGDVPAYPQTLLVQPNLEVVAYRQGLTPSLIVRLSRFATWKGFGPACTLQLQAPTIYRALESGLSFEGILQTLEQHAMRPTPPAVVESLRTWADKRDRISIYPAATLFEFASPEDLNEALARGLPGIRLSERLLAVASENGVDFRHFRLTGTRDYGLPPEKCVTVEEDGVTLAVDVARSDLMLETELLRFAEPLDGAAVSGRRRYRLTPASLTAGRTSGLSLQDLEEWSAQRTGRALSPAARLLLNGAEAAPLEVHRQLVLHLPTSDVADGLLQWPGTRALIRERLGPTALVIAEDDLDILQERLGTLGMSVTVRL
jgi:hypothetical protein